MSRTASSAMSGRSKRFYSMERLKAALKKSMPTGLFKKKKSEKGDEQVVNAYLFKNISVGKRDRSVSPRKLKEMRESFSGAPAPKLLKREKFFKKHQRSHSDVMSPEAETRGEDASSGIGGFSKVERDVFQRELAKI